MVRGTTHVVELLDLATGKRLSEVLQLQLSADTGWAPRWSATVTVVDAPILGGATPPRFVGLRWTRHEGAAVPLSDWTALLGGAALSEWTGLGLLSPRAVTSAVGGDSTAGGLEVTELELMVRTIDRDLLEGTATLSLTSCEMELQDLLSIVLPDRTVAYTTVVPLVADVLARAVPGAALVETPTDKALPTVPTIIEAGMSAWDVIEPALDAAEMLLYADSRQEYHLVRRRRGTIPALTIGTDQLTEYTDAANLADGYRAATIIKTVDTKLGRTQIDGSGGTPGNTSDYDRADFREYQRTLTGAPGTYYSWLATSRDRQGAKLRGAKLTTPARPRLRPDDLVRVTSPEPVRGTVSSITWTYPDGLMSVELESVTTA